MDEAIDVFEITDHTSATSLEEFVSTLEELFVDKWKLTQYAFDCPLERDELTKSAWQMSVHEINSIPSYEYRLTLYRVAEKSSEESNFFTDQQSTTESAVDNTADGRRQLAAANFAPFEDFLSGKNEFVQSSSIRDTHILIDWFPMRAFVVITPLKSKNRIISENDSHTLNSCVLIALSNCRCSVPVFIQVNEPWRQMFQGIMLHGLQRVIFNSVHLRRAPEDCQFLSTLLDNIYKEELGYRDVSVRPQIKVGFKFTYSLDVTLANSISCSVEDCILDVLQNHTSAQRRSSAATTPTKVPVEPTTSRISLPLRALESPIYDALVSAVWPSVYADTVTESPGFTDLDPLQAPKWTCRLVLNENFSSSLYEIVRAFVERLQRDMASSPRVAEYSDLFDKHLLRRQPQQKPSQQLPVSSVPVAASSSSTSVSPQLPKRQSIISNMGERALNRITESRFQSSLRRLQNSGIQERLQFASQLGELLSHVSAGPGNFKKEHYYQQQQNAAGETVVGVDFISADAPISRELLVLFISFLFPQLPSYDTNNAESTYNIQFKYAAWLSTDADRSSLHATADTMRGKILKTAASDSLPERLAIVCALVRSGGTVGLFALVWLQFLAELRYCYENGIRICGVAPGVPDHSTCLLHQKLQMLNYCIDRRLSRQRQQQSLQQQQQQQSTLPSSAAVTVMLNDAAGTNVVSGDDDDDDGVADKFVSPTSSVTSLVESAVATPNKNHQRPSSTKKSLNSSDDTDEFFDAHDEKVLPTAAAEGRKELLEHGITLLNHPEIPLYIPETQEPACATDDMLAELVTRLEAMGDSPESRKRKARLQSESLYSDMEAFKAANPGCCLEDFVRWYSPRDFINNDDDKNSAGDSTPPPSSTAAAGNRLSDRMLIPGNTWTELWNMASPRPITRQKRLFDETQQAERVLKGLYTLQIADVVQLLVPCLLTGAANALASEAARSNSFSSGGRTKQNDDNVDSSKIDDAVIQINNLYAHIGQCLRTSAQQQNSTSVAGGDLTVDQLTPVLDEMRSIERSLLRRQFIVQRLNVGAATRGSGNNNSQVSQEEMESLVMSLHSGNEFEIIGGSQAPVARLFYQSFMPPSLSPDGAAAADDEVISFRRETSSTTATGGGGATLFAKKQPIRKEYIFKCMYGRPVANECSAGPQRLYVSYCPENELRMMSAFSEDVSWC